MCLGAVALALQQSLRVDAVVEVEGAVVEQIKSAVSSKTFVVFFRLVHCFCLLHIQRLAESLVLKVNV